MRIVQVDPTRPDPRAIADAALVLRRGELVAFPTETVYGLGANALDPAAVDRIYAAKGRPAYNPIIVHVADAAGARAVAAEWPERAQRLAAAFWPGPLTIVLPKRPIVPDGVTAGLPSVGVRVPAHPVALALITAASMPIAAPSANRSTELSPTSADHVAKSLGNAVDLILDAGPTRVGIESTVVDLTRDPPVLLRPGMISITDLERVVGPVVGAGRVAGEAARPAPVMLDRHYSPRATLVLAGAADVAHVMDRERARGRRVGALVLASPLRGEHMIEMPADAPGYAARLYESLHALDDAGCAVIVVERVAGGREWDGIRDRLDRAARPPG